MGVEILLAMALAGAVTRAFERSKRRSAAAWQQAHQRAKENSQRRQAEAQQRRNTRRAAFEKKRASPTHPIGMAVRVGRFAGAAYGAVVAGARAAPEGARIGRAEGARFGRSAAREGWTLAGTWREWRAQRGAERAQQTRKAQHDGKACACGRSDPRWLVATGDGSVVCIACLRKTAWDRHRGWRESKPGDGRACPKCGRATTNLLTTGDDGNPVCVPCLLKARAREARRNDRNTGPPPPLLVHCLSCRAPISREVAEATGGWCHECAAQRRRDDTTGPGQGESAESDPRPGAGPHSTTQDEPEIVDAEIVEDDDTQPDGDQPQQASPPTIQPLVGQEDEPDQAQQQNTSANDNTSDEENDDMSTPAINGGNGAGGSGETYTATLSSVANATVQATSVHNNVSSIADDVSARQVDSETQTLMKQMVEYLQQAQSTGEDLVSHVQNRHEGVAEGVSQAGGSSNVAQDITWYDD